MERNRSRDRSEASRRAAMLVAVLLLDGCVAGIARVRAPVRLPAESLPPLAERVTFDVCMGRRIPRERDQRAAGERIRAALSRAGVEAELVATPGSPARVTITEREPRYEGTWSYAVSAYSFSIVPGYRVERRPVDVIVALRSAQHEHVEYERRVERLVWAPFVLYPDFAGVVGATWTSAKLDDRGLEATIRRLGDDLRVRLGRTDAGPQGSDDGAVVCPRWVGPPE